MGAGLPSGAGAGNAGAFPGNGSAPSCFSGRTPLRKVASSSRRAVMWSARSSSSANGRRENPYARKYAQLCSWPQLRNTPVRRFGTTAEADWVSKGDGEAAEDSA